MGKRWRRTSHQIRVVEPIDPTDCPRDEEILDEMGDKVVRIREGQGFWSIALTNWVKRRWPSLSAFRTGTDTLKGLIYIYWASPDGERVKYFRWYGRDRGVYMSLYIPLRKMGLRVKRDEQWELPVFIVPMENAPFALLLRLKDRHVKRRRRSPRKSRAKRRAPAIS